MNHRNVHYNEDLCTITPNFYYIRYQFFFCRETCVELATFVCTETCMVTIMTMIVRLMLTQSEQLLIFEINQ